MEASNEQIRAHLDQLVGLPLWAAGRAADMLWLHFGAEVHAPTGIRGTFALHAQCHWRISNMDGVVVGSGDLFEPAEDQQFEPLVPGRALADHLLRSWIIEHASAPLQVVAVELDRARGFVLRLQQDSAFEVFPHRSTTGARVDHELWRLLDFRGRESAHLVVSTSGAELQR